MLIDASTWEEVPGDPIAMAAKLISEGRIVAVKGIEGFHIAADPYNDEVVAELRRRKQRPQKPFAMMAIGVEAIERCAYVSALERSLLTSPERPIVLLRKKDVCEISKLVSPGLDRDGYMLYYTALHYLLLKETRYGILIMTSGNPRGLPMCRDDECVKKRLRHVVDFELTHNRDIVNRVDDSVIRVSHDRVMFIRRGRGYAPRWIKLPFNLEKPVIAFGAELQNAGAIGFKDKAVLTPYIGDTDDLDTLSDLDRALKYLITHFSIDPSKAVIVADKHPRYQSRMLAERYAKTYRSDIIYMQHHHAHTLSCAVDNSAEEGIAIAIDGVGYGDDGNIWGGEVISFTREKYSRHYHLKYIPMPGGDLASIYPVRMLIGILSMITSDEKWIEDLLRAKGLIKWLRGEEEISIAIKQAREGPHRTSSVGRFLDAVSAYLGICGIRTYEGEPAIKLEAYARGGKLLDIEIPVRGGEIDTVRFFQSLIEVEGKINDLALTTLYRLGEALVKAALKAGAVDKIYVSGGAAVNEYILRGMIDNSEGIEIVTPRRVPAGDGGIALGQVAFLQP